VIFAVTKVAHRKISHQHSPGRDGRRRPKDKADNSIYHMFDTGKGATVPPTRNVIKKIIDGGWEEVRWLERKGIHFSRDEEGSIAKRQFGGHTVEFGKGDALRPCSWPTEQARDDGYRLGGGAQGRFPLY